MATDCGPCENTDYTPEALCCPDTQVLVNSVDGRDRNCRLRRVIPIKGLFGTINSKAGFLDGSSEKPIFTDVELVTASNGYVIIQTEEGRILAIQPGEDSSTQLLTLVYDGGVIKFAAVNNEDLTFTDANLESIKSGMLVSLTCAGADGKVQFGKFSPGCEGTRALVIDADGNVTCDDIEIGACRDVTPVNEFDTIWGCKDGIFSPILPVEDKVLVGTGTSPDTKWALGDYKSGIELITPRVLLASGAFTSPAVGVIDTSNISWAAQTGYDAGYRYALVRAILRLGSNGMDYNGQLQLDGQSVANAQVREHPTLSGDFDTDSNQQFVIIPGSKNSVLTLLTTDLGNTNAGGLNEASYTFYHEGWAR